MADPVEARVRRRRDALRAQGLRPVQIWVPDSRRFGFPAECRRQARATAGADQGDADLAALMEQSLEAFEDER